MRVYFKRISGGSNMHLKSARDRNILHPSDLGRILRLLRHWHRKKSVGPRTLSTLPDVCWGGRQNAKEGVWCVNASLQRPGMLVGLKMDVFVRQDTER
jgi:hypothetical protein